MKGNNPSSKKSDQLGLLAISPKDFMSIKRILFTNGKYMDCMSDNEVEISVEDLMIRYARYNIESRIRKDDTID